MNLTIGSELFSVDLNKKTSIQIPDLKLFYLHIKYLKINDFVKENIFYPAYICPLESRINEFGMNEDYFDIGLYICKILDYTKRCKGIKCSEDYSFQQHYF